MSTTCPLRELLPIIIVVSKTEGKITKCWLVNKEGTFFLILAAKRAKLLTHFWPSGCLATTYAIEKSLLKKFSITMVSCFEIVDKEYTKTFYDKSKNENMKKRIEHWKNFFKKWANERNFQANLEEYKIDVLHHCRSFVHSVSNIQLLWPLCY